MRSAHDQKVQLLARVVAQAANDTASVNDAELVASTVLELQPPHVRAPVILADYKLHTQTQAASRPLSKAWPASGHEAPAKRLAHRRFCEPSRASPMM